MRIIASLAASIDAKLTPPNVFTHVDLTSPEDINHLKVLRDNADAITFGGGSFRAFPKARLGHNKERTPLQCILTHDGRLDPESPLFRRAKQCPVQIFSRIVPSDSERRRYPSSVTWSEVEKIDEYNIAGFIIERLEDRGVRTLLVEGGGRIIGLFLKARRLQELYLTICPLIFGNIDTPDIVQGVAYSEEEAPRARIKSARTVGNEIFLHFALSFPGPTTPK